jgi:hypothetical protein
VPSGPAAVTVGFGGYIGSSRFDTDDTTAFLVCVLYASAEVKLNWHWFC